MDTNPTDDIESVGRIIQQVKTYRKAQKIGDVKLTRDQYLKHHLSPQDWVLWEQLVKDYLIS